jgi:hypothetical protein
MHHSLISACCQYHRLAALQKYEATPSVQYQKAAYLSKAPQTQQTHSAAYALHVTCSIELRANTRLGSLEIHSLCKTSNKNAETAVKLRDLLAGEMIRAMGVMHREAGYGDDIQPFIAAGGIEALVRVAVTGWPAEGKLSSSSHPYDALANLRDGPFSMPELSQQLGMGDGDWASPRRIALDCLADMSNYQ